MYFMNHAFLEAAPAAAEQPSALSSLMGLLPFVVLLIVFYFFMIKPQRKQEKETAEMRNSLGVGDEVVTIGGIMGRVVKVKDDYVVIETGSDRVKIKFRKSAIGSVEKKAGDDDGKKHSTFKVSTAKPAAEGPSSEGSAPIAVDPVPDETDKAQ